MRDNRKEYYEQPAFWDHDYLTIPEERGRIYDTINIIPPDVGSILDVGCGNGSFVNALEADLPGRYKLVGLDSSKEALKYVTIETVQGSVDVLPFKGESVDLVTCMEVLEHLTLDEFRNGVSEIQRVSAKYIIVSVPNCQELKVSVVMCPECYCWFNPGFHMRSFNKHRLSNLFEKYRLVTIKEMGPAIDRNRRFVANLYRLVMNPLPPANSMCPQCGYLKRRDVNEVRSADAQKSILVKLLLMLKCMMARVVPSRQRREWLLVLYKSVELPEGELGHVVR